jgi:hypothetical protein
MARISLDPPRTLSYRIGTRFVRRRYGVSTHLSEAELVELTAIVAVENLRSRINSALGLTAQGFKDRCEIPAAGSMTGR